MATIIDIAVAWAVNIANSPDHGYCQENRWGPDYDCSSLLITAWENAGVPVKSVYGATRTRNMYTPFIQAGFVDVTAFVDINTGAGTRKGDIWLVPANHVAMMATDTHMVEANYNELLTATGGATGDQRHGMEVEEIGVRPWHKLKSAPWSYVLRYPGGTADFTIDKSMVASGNYHLSVAERNTNGAYIAAYLMGFGWSLNAICGILGNMQFESGCNPGIWESLDEGNTSRGFGLVQWTPATKLIDWAIGQGYNYQDIDCQLDRIKWEHDNGGQYYATDNYPESFSEFVISSADPYYLGCAFAWNYERSWTVLYGTEAEKEEVRKQRGGAAQTWYAYLSGLDLDFDSIKKKKKGLSRLLFLAMASD